MNVWCLAIHASWACQHRGACCRAGWAIPVEGPAFDKLRVHFADRPSQDPLFMTGGPLPEGAAAILGSRADGECVFHHGQRCEVHRDLGRAVLPSACQQFPRVVLHDGRGTFLTLSHYCPTAAGLLLKGGLLDRVPAPPSLALNGALEGLDATTVLPPLLRPGLLMDLDGYDGWERRSLELLSSGSLTAEEAIDRIEVATREIEKWNPIRNVLADAVARAFERPAESNSRGAKRDDRGLFEVAAAAVPPGLKAPIVPPDHASGWLRASRWWPQFDGPVRAFIAAHLFGNWVAYCGNGLMTVVEWQRICLAVLRVEAARQELDAPHLSVEERLIEAIRNSDLLLVHLADIRKISKS